MRSFILADSRQMISLRSSPDMRGHGPLSNASRAAAMAAFASATLATGILAIASPLYGLWVGLVTPPSASTNLPPI